MTEVSRGSLARQQRQESALMHTLADSGYKESTPNNSVTATGHGDLSQLSRGARAPIKYRPPQQAERSKPPRSRIAVRSQGKILLIDPQEIIAFEACSNYVRLRRQEDAPILRVSISTIAENLKPYGFIRIHRSIIVNGSHVLDIQPMTSGEYGLRVTGGRVYMASRTYKGALRSLADLWIGIGSFSEQS